MFDDYILDYLEQPTQSLPKLVCCMEEYGQMSGYRLNISKTQIITFNYEPTRDIIQRYQLKWDADSIKYLGVYIPINFGRLISKIKTNVRSWQVIPFLNLSSRVEEFK